MARTYVVTGSASGIGLATKQRLQSQGAQVIGVDLHSADVEADLSTREGRAAMVQGVRELTAGKIDAIVACAGIAVAGASDATRARIDNTSAALAIRVNFFGAVASLDGLRPLLDGSDAPRAVAIASVALHGARGGDPALRACMEGDEEAAVAAVGSDAGRAYQVSKRALARWVRREAITDRWAAAGIPLNAIAPSIITTPMTQEGIDSGTATQFIPMPLHGPGMPEDVAALLDFLASPTNKLITGQVVFIDGGTDAVRRGDEIWA